MLTKVAVLLLLGYIGDQIISHLLGVAKIIKGNGDMRVDITVGGKQEMRARFKLLVILLGNTELIRVLNGDPKGL